MSSGGARVVLGASELGRRKTGASSPLLSELEVPPESGAARPLARAELLALSPPERRAAVRETVCRTIASVLGLSEAARERLAPTARIDELGLDSLMTLEVFVGLGREFDLTPEPDWFPPRPSLAAIADELASRITQGGDAR